jgi:hypothetical protein
MERVQQDDAIFMWGKWAGIVGIGRAKAKHEVLEVSDPDRVRIDDCSEREWRIPVEWLAWVEDDRDAYPCSMPNASFIDASGDQYRELREGVRQHFLGGSVEAERKHLIGEPAATPITAPLTFSGRWVGEKGDLWDLQADLEVFGSRVKGQIRWALVECPPALPWAKRVGHSGYEFVEGSLESECLSLRGYKVDDPALLAPAEYTIVFGPGRQTFEGTSRSKKGGCGTLRGMVATPSRG